MSRPRATLPQHTGADSGILHKHCHKQFRDIRCRTAGNSAVMDGLCDRCRITAKGSRQNADEDRRNEDPDLPLSCFAAQAPISLFRKPTDQKANYTRKVTEVEHSSPNKGAQKAAKQRAQKALTIGTCRLRFLLCLFRVGLSLHLQRARFMQRHRNTVYRIPICARIGERLPAAGANRRIRCENIKQPSGFCRKAVFLVYTTRFCGLPARQAARFSAQ